MSALNKQDFIEPTSCKKILIFGFPHCGTTILKTIIGHIDSVEEYLLETDTIDDISTNKPFIICKTPYCKDEYFSDKYKDYIKIFIIRNPLFVFSSLNKRFDYKIPTHPSFNHSFNLYEYTIKKFIEYNNTDRKDIYTIKYEDLFENNYHNLKNILNIIGLNYDDNIFNNDKYKNVIWSNVNLVDNKPENKYTFNHLKTIRQHLWAIENMHRVYRTWQINQPFTSQNDISKIDLTEFQKKQILTNSYVLQVYADINSVLNS